LDGKTLEQQQQQQQQKQQVRGVHTILGRGFFFLWDIWVDDDDVDDDVKVNLMHLNNYTVSTVLYVLTFTIITVM